MSQNRVIEDRDNLDKQGIEDNLKNLDKSVEEYKKNLNPSPPNYVSLRRNLIDEVEPFSSLRKKGYYTSEHYELRIRDLTEDSGKLVFFDHKNKISDIEKFTLNPNTDITKQLRKPSKKLLKRLKGVL